MTINPTPEEPATENFMSSYEQVDYGKHNPLYQPNKSMIARVDLSIGGTPHHITCPVSEVDNLNNNADLLNQKLRELRRGLSHKNPNNEELLVVHCLELYDQINELKKLNEKYAIEQQNMDKLVDKMLEDIKQIL